MQTITKKIKLALDVYPINDPDDVPFATAWQIDDEPPPPKAKTTTRHYVELEVDTNIDMPALRVSV